MNGPEHLCAWYLRLNGYLTTANFYLHDRHETLGEVDVIGVRFPHSNELHFEDDNHALRIPPRQIDVVLAEAKRGKISSLGNSLTTGQNEALEYVLMRVGGLEQGRVKDVSAKLYESGPHSLTEDGFNIRVVCFAESIDDELANGGVTFVPWMHVLEFVRNRFINNQKLKAQHDQWELFGQYLWNRLVDVTLLDPAKFFSEWEKRAGRMKTAFENEKWN